MNRPSILAVLVLLSLGVVVGWFVRAMFSEGVIDEHTIRADSLSIIASVHRARGDSLEVELVEALVIVEEVPPVAEPEVVIELVVRIDTVLSRADVPEAVQEQVTQMVDSLEIVIEDYSNRLRVTESALFSARSFIVEITSERDALYLANQELRISLEHATTPIPLWKSRAAIGFYGAVLSGGVSLCLKFCGEAADSG